MLALMNQSSQSSPHIFRSALHKSRMRSRSPLRAKAIAAARSSHHSGRGQVKETLFFFFIQYDTLAPLDWEHMFQLIEDFLNTCSKWGTILKRVQDALLSD